MIAGRRFRRSIPVVLAAFLTTSGLPRATLLRKGEQPRMELPLWAWFGLLSVWLHRGITLERFML